MNASSTNSLTFEMSFWFLLKAEDKFMPADGLKRQLYSTITSHVHNTFQVCVEENIPPSLHPSARLSARLSILYLIFQFFN